MLYIAASPSFFSFFNTFCVVPCYTELLSGVTGVRRIWILLLLILCVKGWIGPSLGLSLCDCDAYNHVRTASVLLTPGSLKTYKFLIADVILQYLRLLTEVFQSILGSGAVWLVEWFVLPSYTQAPSVTFEEEGTTCLRKVGSHWSKGRSWHSRRPKSLPVLIILFCDIFGKLLKHLSLYASFNTCIRVFSSLQKHGLGRKIISNLIMFILNFQ
jgi:hypothetical protein